MKSIDEMRKSYNSFIERQRVGYEMTATMIGYIVEKMKNAKERKLLMIALELG